MLQSMGSQRVRHDLATEQQKYQASWLHSRWEGRHRTICIIYPVNQESQIFLEHFWQIPKLHCLELRDAIASSL